MSDKSLVIIGAGLAGLATGVYAQLNGYHSHILEHHSQPGGVAAWWRRGQYLIDGGIHFLMGHRPGQAIYDMYRELGTAAPDTVADMDDYGRFLDEASGRGVVVTSDLDRLAADLAALSPADATKMHDLIAGARAFQSAGAFDIGMADPPELAGPLNTLRQLWGMRRVARYFRGEYARPVAEYVQTLRDPVLRDVVENLFLPEVPVWFVLMLLALLASRQIGLLTRGCQGFVESIERRYRDLGGQVTYGATVEKILVEESAGSKGAARAVGVRLADGPEHRADVIVSAADGYSTIFQMLEGRFTDESVRARYRDWKLVRPYVTVSFGAARSFEGEPHFTAYKLRDPFTVGGRMISTLGLRILNYSSYFAPPGHTVIQALFETDWDYWNDLQRDRPRYEAEKERVASEALRRLEAHFRGLSSQVEVTDVATPYTTWRYTLNWRGAYEGWLPTGPQMMQILPRTLPGLDDFYMAGQWVIPGGGVPTCLASGRDVVRVLCRRDRKTFVQRAN